MNLFLSFNRSIFARLSLFTLCFFIFQLKGTELAAKIIEVGDQSEYRSIASAIQAANEGDSIHVNSGRYVESGITISKPLTIYSSELAIIDAAGEAVNLLIVAADDVQISGLVFRNVGTSFLEEAAAIRLVDCQNALITENRIDSCFFGIYLENSRRATISANEIKGVVDDEASAGNAIHAWKCHSLEIKDNNVENHRDGVYFEFVDESYITGNKSRFNLRYGLHFMFSNDDIYENNLFENNGAGVAVMFSKNISMIRNEFIHNWGGASYGLLLKEISDGLIRANSFEKNTIGILAEGANRLIIAQNNFLQNGTALDIKGNCLDNEILQNNFTANTFEVVTNSRYNNNFYNENYWSNYSGYDRDKDGFGDIPFRPVNLFAKITHEVPAASFLLQSPFVKVIEVGEKIFPQFIPETLVDARPKIRPYNYD